MERSERLSSPIQYLSANTLEVFFNGVDRAEKEKLVETINQIRTDTAINPDKYAAEQFIGGWNAICDLYKALEASSSDIASGDTVRILAGVASVSATLVKSASKISDMLLMLGITSGTVSPCLAPVCAALSLIAMMLNTEAKGSRPTAEEALLREITKIINHFEDRKITVKFLQKLNMLDWIIADLQKLLFSNPLDEFPNQQTRKRLFENRDRLILDGCKVLISMSSFAVMDSNYPEMEGALNGYKYITMLAPLHFRMKMAFFLLHANPHFPVDEHKMDTDHVEKVEQDHMKPAYNILGDWTKLQDIENGKGGLLQIWKDFVLSGTKSVRSTRKMAKSCGVVIPGSIFSLRSHAHGNHVCALSDSLATMTQINTASNVIQNRGTPTLFVAFPTRGSTKFLEKTTGDQEVYIYCPHLGRWMSSDVSGVLADLAEGLAGGLVGGVPGAVMVYQRGSPYHFYACDKKLGSDAKFKFNFNHVDREDAWMLCGNVQEGWDRLRTQVGHHVQVVPEYTRGYLVDTVKMGPQTSELFVPARPPARPPAITSRLLEAVGLPTPQLPQLPLEEFKHVWFNQKPLDEESRYWALELQEEEEDQEQQPEQQALRRPDSFECSSGMSFLCEG